MLYQTETAKTRCFIKENYKVPVCSIWLNGKEREVSVDLLIQNTAEVQHFLCFRYFSLCVIQRYLLNKCTEQHRLAHLLCMISKLMVNSSLCICLICSIFWCSSFLCQDSVQFLSPPFQVQLVASYQRIILKSLDSNNIPFNNRSPSLVLIEQFPSAN